MKKTVFLLMLFISTITQAQTVPKQSRLAITQNVKQNSATRIVVQDSITKELNWVLKGNLDSWPKTANNIRNNNIGDVELKMATNKKVSFLNDLNSGVAYINESGRFFSKTTNGGFFGIDEGSGMNFNNNSGELTFTCFGSSRFRFNPIYLNQIAGLQDIISFTNLNINPPSGNATFNILDLEPFINQTGGANGAIRGMYFNPIIVAGGNDVRAIEVTAGKVIIPDGVNSNEAVNKGQLDNAISGSTSYLSKFSGTNIIRPSSWRETSVGSRLFNATDDGFTTFQLDGSASITNTLKILSGYSSAVTATATFGTGVQATSNGFADGLLAVSTNGVAGDYDIQSSINGNESNIAEFKDNGVVQASISDVGLATVNGLVSNDKITTSLSIKIGDDTSPANQYTAGTFRYRSLGEVGFPEVVTQDSFGNYNWRTLYHSGNLNLNNYLSIAGGTLTGALNGTSGTFSGTLQNTGVLTNNGNITATGTGTSLGVISGNIFSQISAGFSLTYGGATLNSSFRLLWSQDGSSTGSKDIAIQRPVAGLLAITNGGSGAVTDSMLRDIRLRNLSALGLNVTAGTAPASATATGTAGEIRITSTFIYYCTATNTWVRSALTTW